MSTRTVEQIDSWDTVPFSGGYGGLHDLADSEFSGAVVAGPTRLFMLNGNVVGVLDGSIEDFEDASGTARKAPHPGLPLLAVMQERSEEVRAKYYTEDTPIAEVDQTLSSGGFTGYVELSENVLSGDYYQIYHQGRSMSVAWVGNSDELVTEDEAFEQANDEVGIYEVRPVEIEIVEIPDAGPTGGGATQNTDTSSGHEEQSADSAVSDDPQAGTEPQGGDGAPADEHSNAARTDQRAGRDEQGSRGSRANQTEPSGRTTDTHSDPVAKTGTTAGRSNDDEARSERQRDPEPADDVRDRSTTEADSRSDASEPNGDRSRTSEQSERQPSERRAPSGSEGQPDARDPDRNERDRREQTTEPRSEPTEQQSRTDTARTPAEQTDRQSRTDRSSTPTEQDQQSRTDTARTPAEQTDRQSRTDTTRTPTEQTNQPTTDRTQSRSETPEQSGTDGTAGAGVRPAPNDPSAGGASDLETRSIPSLDPSHSGTASAAATAAAERTKAEAANAGAQSDPAEPTRSEPEQQPDPERHPGAPTDDRANGGTEPSSSEPRDRADPAPADPEPRREPSEPDPGRADDAGPDPERVAELERELAETETERDQLQDELDSLATERDALQDELGEARAEIERLEERLEEMASEDDDTPAAETRLSEREAIDQTNLFVRYKSKGDATLEAVHAGQADRSSVDDNLRLEFHTQFDAATAAVGNTEFETFLSESIQFRFVDWLVRNLLFEIRDTGNPEAMAELYDALPKIDRAELNGQITVQYTEDGEQHRAQEQFDVVVRDRMGNPLIVANINDSRDPATDGMMTDLITRAERVGSSSESLAGAFLVTESFFEPPALETAEEATSSGLLSRDKRKSFVNLSRKDGYHLCLVEARNQEFHLAVPEL